MASGVPRTSLGHHDAESIYYRDLNLVDDLIGAHGFVEVFFRQITGRFCTPEEAQALNAVLVSVMEHGFTPSAIAARLVYSNSSDSLSAGVAAGLLAVGDQFVGTMEGCGLLLDRILAAADPAVEAAAIVQEYRARHAAVPGFGHHIHPDGDPRAVRLLGLSRSLGVAGSYGKALDILGTELRSVLGRNIPCNVTGAVAAVLGDVGVPAKSMRGFALVSRAAGLVAHLGEEQASRTSRFMWETIDGSVQYEPHGSDNE